MVYVVGLRAHTYNKDVTLQVRGSETTKMTCTMHRPSIDLISFRKDWIWFALAKIDFLKDTSDFWLYGVKRGPQPPIYQQQKIRDPEEVICTRHQNVLQVYTESSSTTWNRPTLTSKISKVFKSPRLLNSGASKGGPPATNNIQLLMLSIIHYLQHPATIHNSFPLLSSNHPASSNRPASSIHPATKNDYKTETHFLFVWISDIYQSAWYILSGWVIIVWTTLMT